MNSRVNEFTIKRFKNPTTFNQPSGVVVAVRKRYINKLTQFVLLNAN